MVTTRGQTNKAMVWEFWQRLADATPDRVARIVQSSVHDDVSWHGPHPLNDLEDADALIEGFWRPLLHSFPGLRRESDIFLAGETSDGTEWIAGTGYFTGLFAHDWLGIPARGKAARIRFGEFCRVEGGKIAEIYLLLDLIDLMLQAGFRVLPQSNGDEARVPAPRTGDGVLLTAHDDETRQSLALVEAMLGSMGQYDLKNPMTLSHASFWRTDMCWYGPCGIGTARGMGEYIPIHQRPFLEAFPDREIADHAALFAEGDYITVTGWPDVVGTHRGTWLGCPPTGRRVAMRVMDFWRREGNLLAENWVLIDVIDIFRQFGVDLFARLAEQAGKSVDPRR